MGGHGKKKKTQRKVREHVRKGEHVVYN